MANIYIETKSNIQTSHYNWIDLIRIVAIFQVILIHLSFVIFYKDETLSPNWVAANLYDSISRMCVPLFIMVSGYLLLSKSEPISVFFKKRFVKVGIPALFWSAFYFFRGLDKKVINSLSLADGVPLFLKAIYLDNAEIHLWFLYVLIGIYLVVPIIRVFVSAATSQVLIYFSIIWFVASSLIEFVERLSGFETALVIPVVSGYVGYYIIGYLLAKVNLSRRGQILSALGIIIAIAVTFFGTNLFSDDASPLKFYLYSYFSPPTVMAALCGFLLLKYLGQHLGQASKIIRIISNTSFGIYLTHIFIIELLRKGTFGFRLYSWMGPSWYMIPITAIAVFFISFTIVFVLQKIPIIKLLVP